MKRKKPKFEVGERVEIHSWIDDDLGIITEVKWVEDRRAQDSYWGYKIDYENGGVGFNSYAPEGQMRKFLK